MKVPQKKLSSRNQGLYSFSIKTLELKKKIQNFQLKTINQGRNKKIKQKISEDLVNYCNDGYDNFKKIFQDTRFT